MKKLAFCFLIYDVINNDELWNIFFKNVDINKYTIYIHYKFNKPLKYFEQYKLKNCIETKYEDQTIPLAYNILFREAYKDENNYKFIILSGSCIPFKSFDFVYYKLTQTHYGYLNVCPQAQCFPNCNDLLEVIDKNLISKSSNWFILNRKLVESLCFDKDDFLNTHYNNVYAPAEYFYYTFIKILNLENEIITTPNVASDATTFANWAGMDYKYVTLRGLQNYNSITQDEIQYLMFSKCLFGRKFTSECVYFFINNKDYIEYISS
jgi:hypothetical protein